MFRRIIAVAALTVAVLAAVIVPAASSPAVAASRAPATRVFTWQAALYRMRHGAWCWRVAPGRFACTRADIDLPGIALAADPGQLLLRWLLRHDWMCSAGIIAPASWICTPR